MKEVEAKVSARAFRNAGYDVQAEPSIVGSGWALRCRAKDEGHFWAMNHQAAKALMARGEIATVKNGKH
jgi:hypothetical protein